MQTKVKPHDKYNFLTPLEELTTERLVFKARDVSQAEELFNLIDTNRIYLRPWMIWEKETTSVTHSKNFLKNAKELWDLGSMFDFSIYDKTTSKMIGSIGLHNLNQKKKIGSLGYWISQEYSGQGLIAEAVQLFEEVALELEIHRLRIECDRQNSRSINVAQRAGFVIEAKLTDDPDFSRGRDRIIFVKLLNPKMEGKITANLPSDFYIEKTDKKDFWEKVNPFLYQVFDKDEQLINAYDYFDEAELKVVKEVRARYTYSNTRYYLIKKKGHLVGWSWGHQDSFDSFYMVNSAVLPEYRGRGLYSRLLEVIMKEVSDEGYEKIHSRHKLSNNSIIISKLKRGFHITNFEVHDLYGVLVQLSYFKNKTRRKVFKYRVGSTHLDDEIKKLLKL